MKRKNPFEADTIAHLLYHRAAKSPRDTAYSFPESRQSYTWLETWNEVRLLAKGLLKLGIRKGDRVALLMQNRMELLVSMFAASCIGAITVPLNAYSKKAEIEAYLRDAAPAVLLTVAEGHRQQYPALLLELMAEVCLEGGTWMPASIFVADQPEKVPSPFLLFSSLMALGKVVDDVDLYKACGSVSPDDPSILLFTSGTSGKPKGVLRTTSSFLTAAKPGSRTSPWLTSIVDRISRHFSLLSLMPLYHLGGIGSVFSNLKSCNVRIVMLSHFHPQRAASVLHEERCQILTGTPYMVQRMLDVPFQYDTSHHSLLGVAFSGAAVGGALIEQAVRKWKLTFFMVTYGSSEAGSVANGTCFLPSGKNLLLRILFQLLQRTHLLSGQMRPEDFTDQAYSLAGRVDKGVEIKIVDPETGVPLPPNEPGEIMIRSRRVMRYTKDHQENSRFGADGWYRSGDLGFIAERGHLTITGRLNRLIHRGGEKISPTEIEHALLRHKDVEEALVLGVPDEMYGEQVCACIVTRKGASLTAEQIRHELEPYLSSFKLPHYVMFLPDLPLSATGKISVAEIKQLVQTRIGEPRKHA